MLTLTLTKITCFQCYLWQYYQKESNYLLCNNMVLAIIQNLVEKIKHLFTYGPDPSILLN